MSGTPPVEPGPGPTPPPAPPPREPLLGGAYRSDGNEFDRERAALNAEAASHRLQARQATQRADEAEARAVAAEAERDRLRTESEARAADAATAQAERDAQTVRNQRYERQLITAEVKHAAWQEHFIDPDLVDTIINHPGVSITADPETGVVSGVAEAIAALKEAKPHLFRQRRTSTGSDSNPPPANPNPPPVNVRSLPPAEYKQRMQDELRRLAAADGRR